MAEATPTDPIISEDQRAIIRRAIESFGLGALWSVVDGYLMDGWTDPDEILTQISYDPNYQQAYFSRFPAVEKLQKENEQRARNGQPPLQVPSPSEYVQMERGYTEVLKDIPGGLATKDNITAWISGGMSVADVDQRVQTATNYINFSGNAAVRQQLRDIYGLSDQEMLAYVLSDQKSKELLATEWETRQRQANVGAAAQAFGVDINSDMRDNIAASSDNSYTFGQASAIFSNVAAQAEDYRRLGDLSGYSTSTQDLVKEQFNLEGGTATTKLKKKLASQERARFNRSSAIGANSLSTRGLGTQ